MKKIFIVCDTETITDARLVFDIAWHVCDSKGNILESFNAIVKDIIDVPFGRYMISKDGFTSRKLENGMRKSEWYLSSIDNGELNVMSFKEIKEKFYSYAQKYNAKLVFCAYNAKFDYTQLNESSKIYGLGEFFDDSVEVIDIMIMALNTFCNTNKFVSWCILNNFVTEKGNVKTGAQIVYAYLMQDANFQERHTALADCDIEKDILFLSKRYKKKNKSFPTMQFFRCPEWKNIQERRKSINQ